MHPSRKEPPLAWELKGRLTSCTGFELQTVDFDSGIATIADARIGFENVRESSRAIGGTHTDDFVWAVRLARIHKGILHRDWSVSTYTKRATFNAEEDEVDVAAVLSNEGVVNFTVVEDSDLNEAFVI